MKIYPIQYRTFLTNVPFKKLITQHEDLFTLIHMSKKIWDPVKKETVHQFHVGFMTHPFLKKNSTHKEQVIKCFNRHSN